MKPPPPHRATTAHLQAVYPFVYEAPLGAYGPLVGSDLLGGEFRFDPWELYAAGIVTNPNVVVLGQLGKGKSTFVKTSVWRHLAHGAQAWVMDPKGEYGRLCAAAGTTPVRLEPGGPFRLNPLDAPAGAGGEERARRRVALLGSLLASALGRTLAPTESAALDLAVRRISSHDRPTLPQLVSALLEPEAADASVLRLTCEQLAAEARPLALALRRMVQGDLAGMFDGETSPGIDLGGPLVVIDLSATFASPALPLIMTCATAWLQSALAASSARRLVVTDEAWAVLSDPGIARWTQATFKLSRAYGVANVIVVHRLSDLRSVGADGSAEQKLAEGLVADSETRVIFAQPPAEAEVTARVLGLCDAERDLIPQLPRGTALWRVGARSYLVEHLVGSHERPVVDTDQAMTVR